MRFPTVSTLAGIALLSGCLITAGCNTPSSGQTTTQPAPPQGQIFRMADAVPLEKIQNEEEDTQMVYRVSAPQVPAALYFGEVISRDNDAVLGALVAMKVGGQWRAVRLDDDKSSLGNCGWEFVGGGPRKDEVWGVLDCMQEDPAWDLALVHSTDGGATWALSRIHKPAYYATFNDFAMARDGHGRVTVFLEADYTDKIKTGYYHYRTKDGGKTWSEPEFEADALLPAEQVPEAEQPTAGHNPRRVMGPMGMDLAAFNRRKSEIRNPKSETNSKFEKRK